MSTSDLVKEEITRKFIFVVFSSYLNSSSLTYGIILVSGVQFTDFCFSLFSMSKIIQFECNF